MLYAATWESVSQHNLPQWYDDAKFGMFVHWGLYSVPAWSPTGYSAMQVVTGKAPATYHDIPDGAFYFNNLNIPDSQTRAYHDKTYGANFAYDEFVAMFNAAIETWDPDAMADFLHDCGARYVVLTTKHHEGFLMWNARVKNPFKQNYFAARDLLGELSNAVRARGMKMGAYYSGGFDWTFNATPIRELSDVLRAMPQSQEYVAYVLAHLHDLMERYEPAVLWNDIGMPAQLNLPQLFADYYNAVPDGVVDDRYAQYTLGALTNVLTSPPFARVLSQIMDKEFGGGAPPSTVKHFDFSTPEYTTYHTTVAKKWEATRGIGHSFGYNRNETPDDYMTVTQLVQFVADVVSKNGNVLLNVGPQADGTIPQIEQERVRGLGAWLKVNGEAIYNTRPWTRAEGTAQANGATLDVRFTRNGENLYAIVFASDAPREILVPDIDAQRVTNVSLLGSDAPLTWRANENDLAVTLPELPQVDTLAETFVLKLTMNG